MSDSRPRATLLAGLALAGALLVGGALGYALGRRPGPMKLKQMALIGVTRADLIDSLQLDAGQRTRVDGILDGAELRARESISRMMGDVQQVTNEARDSVRAGLTQAQRIRFDSLMTRAVPMRPRAPLPPKGTTP